MDCFTVPPYRKRVTRASYKIPKLLVLLLYILCVDDSVVWFCLDEDERSAGACSEADLNDRLARFRGQSASAMNQSHVRTRNKMAVGKLT